MAGLSVGTRKGPYELLTPLGAGGMGEVWKARDTRLDRVVAIKFSQAQFTDRFAREARAIAALNHPNIAQIHDVGEDYLVMEFVDGERVRPVESPRKLLDVAVQIADGLAAAHAAGIVHRDLKPDNILLTRESRVKILDFGLAKLTSKTSAEDATRTIAITDPGTVMGTVAYMSPEQARGQEVTARSDQFSLGLILYELASGNSNAARMARKRAFQRESAAETKTAIIREEAEPLPARIPVPLRWVIERLLAKDPADRYDTTRGLYLELRPLRERLTETTTTANVAPPPTMRDVRWMPIAITAVIATLAALLIIKATEPWSPDQSQYRFVPLATESYPEYGAVWSPDGRSIAYCAIAENEYRIMVKSPDGSAPSVLARIPYQPSGFIDLTSLSWSADSARLHFVFRRETGSVERTGGAPKQRSVSPGVVVFALAEAPDGSAMAVLESERTGKETQFRLTVETLSGKADVKRLLESKRPLQKVSWSPDSSRLLVTQGTGTGRRLWLVNRSGSAKSILEGEGLNDIEHAWLPGNRYALLSTTPSNQGIRVIDTETGVTTPILPSQSAIGSVAVSPDGAHIVYTHGVPGTILLEIPLDGSAPRTFLSSSLNHSELEWSPAGDEFVYVRGEEIRVRNLKGTSERTVVSRRDFPGYQGNLHFEKPSFSPDGQRILYTLFGARGKEIGIWISPATGGPPAIVEKAEGYAPVWSGDGKSVFYVSRGMWKYRLGSDGPPAQIYANACDPAPSPDGKWILCAYGTNANGLVSSRRTIIVSSDGKETRTLTEGPMVNGTWAKDSQSIYVLSPSEPQQLLQIDIATKRTRVVRELPQHLDIRGPYGGPTRLAMSPDGKSVITTVRRNESDIWVLEGFTPPRTFWEKLWPWKH